MKQHIDLSDLESLSEKGKEKLREWAGNKQIEAIESAGYQVKIYGNNDDFTPLLSIGQMIEFLNTRAMTIQNYKTGWKLEHNYDYASDELCDSLWAAVKEELEK